MSKAQTRKPAGPKKQGGLAGDLIHVIYDQVPIDDLEGLAADELEHVARNICDMAALRRDGEHKIRVFNPERKNDGWHTPHTVVMIVNNDRPFIIDSLTAHLASQGVNIEVILHPITAAARDKTGRMTKIANAKEIAGGMMQESVVYIRLEQLLSRDACAQLEDSLRDVLEDVQAATGDWRDMLSIIDGIVADKKIWSGVAADAAGEARDFLSYLRANNFTFLGYARYDFSSKGKGAARNSALGVLRRNNPFSFGADENAAERQALYAAEWPVVVSKLVDHLAAVHRRVPMDAVSVIIMDARGKVAGVHFFVGLFTSSTYSCRTGEVPVVRRKVADTISRAGFIKGSHDAKALEHILEKMPRDELFQASTDDVYMLSLGILRLQTRQRIALFSHVDPLGRHMSCLVYVPRDRYNTKFMTRAAQLIEQGVGGKVVTHFTTLDDSPLARLLFTVRLDKPGGDYDHAALESRLAELGREWDERIKNVLVAALGKVKGAELAHVYGRAFNSAYHASIEIGNAVHDIRQLEEMRADGGQIRVQFYRLQGAAANSLRLKVYHRHTPVPLSDILPVLENMGLRSISEMPYEARPQNSDVFWIHDFELISPAHVDIDAVRAQVEEAFIRIWRGEVESDGLNQLIVTTGLNWEEARVLRAYSAYMRQARFPYSRIYVEQVLNSYPKITCALVDYFKALHDPKGDGKKAAKVAESIDAMLQDVMKLDHDRILRGLRGMMGHTLRTNYFQREKNGEPKQVLAIKLDSKNIDDLPLPRPHVEIFVYSSRVEAVHLRGGEVARGGIRWSDRHDDFRTEVLGLLKSQMVKNTVIVPVGAKGGFVVKQPPKEGGREAYLAEGIACYKLFVQALLDITDNNVKGKVVRPKDVLCHDGEDPYLVVAADKGTATFSDIANELSEGAGFWLQDAFASGGATGYDHKKLGITARGGWESVKRHFREIGKDIQSEEFTAVGVGDMAGDVFGNAMLLSKKIRLLGAFNHVHIFCDPDPDAAKSFAERQRMFKARGGWDTYNKDLISQGGGVFERSAKSIRLTPQIKKCFGLTADSVTPDELIRAMLKAEVELLWFGGIGTFIKSSRQSHADADDKSNDALRVDGRDIRAKVVGEGANLGVTQQGRIEYARRGGRINTDFVDNSGGVDCSDHEVNIKILLTDVVARGKLTQSARNKLLEDMTDEVSSLVLADNYQQSQSLSLQALRAPDDLDLHRNFVRALEKSGLIKRALESLPDEDGFAQLSKDNSGLARPELAVLSSYAKINVYRDLIASDVPDAPEAEQFLFDYFPKVLHKYKDEIRAHKLRREIIATQLTNLIVNRMGPVFMSSRVSKTGRDAADVARAFLIALSVYDIPALWAQIEALDNKVPAAAQLSALQQTYSVIKRSVTWFLRYAVTADITAAVESFGPGLTELRKSIRKMVPDDVGAAAARAEAALVESGMTPAIAAHISAIKLLAAAGDIVNLSHKTDGNIREISMAYFRIGERLGLDWLRQQAGQIVPANPWTARVIGGLMDDYYLHQATMTAAVFASVKKGQKINPGHVDEWFAAHGGRLEKIESLIAEMQAQPAVSVEMLTVAGQRIGQLVHQA